jgi:hypothetical protein
MIYYNILFPVIIIVSMYINQEQETNTRMFIVIMLMLLWILSKLDDIYKILNKKE